MSFVQLIEFRFVQFFKPKVIWHYWCNCQHHGRDVVVKAACLSRNSSWVRCPPLVFRLKNTQSFFPAHYKIFSAVGNFLCGEFWAADHQGSNFESLYIYLLIHSFCQHHMHEKYHDVLNIDSCTKLVIHQGSETAHLINEIAVAVKKQFQKD